MADNVGVLMAQARTFEGWFRPIAHFGTFKAGWGYAVIKHEL